MGRVFQKSTTKKTLKGKKLEQEKTTKKRKLARLSDRREVITVMVTIRKKTRITRLIPPS